MRQGFVIGFVLSALFHYEIAPFSVLPAGPPIEFHEQAGELTIPVDLIGEGTSESQGAKSKASQGGGVGAAEGLTDAGRDAVAGDGGANADAGKADASKEEEDAGPGIAIADGGIGRDPQALLGAAAAVSAGPNNITLLVNFIEVRKHPDAQRLGLVLGGIRQWREFMSDAHGAPLLDPMRDADWMVVMGPSLIDTQNDAVFVHYSPPDSQVDKVIDTVSRSHNSGGPIDLGVRGVKAWKAHVDGADRVFIRPRAHVAVIVPASHARQFAAVLAVNPVIPHVHAGEAMSMRALRPGGSIHGVDGVQDWSELRLWITPRPSDGGGDLYVEGDCPDAAAAQSDAESLKRLIQEKNGAFVRLLTAGFLNNVDVQAVGSQVHMHINGTQTQIEALLSLAAGRVGVALPAPGHATTP